MRPQVQYDFRDRVVLITGAASGIGRLDCLVPAAAIGEDQLLRSMTPAPWERTMAETLNGVFYLVRCAVGHMDKTGGAIMLLSSMSGHTGEAVLVTGGLYMGG